MRRNYWILLASISFIIFSCNGKIDLEKDKDAIKSLIEGEIRASFYGDFQSWVNFFAHQPYTVIMQTDRHASYYWEGWEEINTTARDFIRPGRTAGRIYEGYDDYVVKVYEEAALVTFKTKTTIIRKGDEFDIELIGSEVRLLEKQDGEWKITYLGSIIH